MSQSERYTMYHLNGFVAVGIALGLSILALMLFRSPFAIAPIIFVFVILGRFKILEPNTALVSTIFGKYAGVLAESGFYWVLPFYQTQLVSLRTDNYVTPTLKVNDASGTPIEVAAAIVYVIENPAAAVLDVEDTGGFMRIQSESALRMLVSHYPYTANHGQDCLSGHSSDILQQFRNMVQARVKQAGIHIKEARFTHLAYAPEIAQAMLRKQQAEAVISARHTLVRGAITMVEGTVKELERRQIVTMTEPEKAKLITNMMTVLLSEESASPVVNVSGD